MEPAIEIQHGCIQSPTDLNSWLYVEVKVKVGAQHNESERFSYPFRSTGEDKPEIGDFIDGGMLVKRTTPKVNSDWSRWKDKDLYGNP